MPTISCQHCRGLISTTPAMAGQSFACPHCDGTIVIPAVSVGVPRPRALPAKAPPLAAAPPVRRAPPVRNVPPVVTAAQPAPVEAYDQPFVLQSSSAAPTAMRPIITQKRKSGFQFKGGLFAGAGGGLLVLLIMLRMASIGLKVDRIANRASERSAQRSSQQYAQSMNMPVSGPNPPFNMVDFDGVKAAMVMAMKEVFVISDSQAKTFVSAHHNTASIKARDRNGTFNIQKYGDYLEEAARKKYKYR